MDENPRQFVIADSQYLIVRSLAELLAERFSFTLKEIARNRKDLERLVSDGSVALLIIDTNQFELKTVSDLKNTLLRDHLPRVLVLNNTLSRNDVNTLHTAGIRNIILKTAGEDEIVTAVEHTLQGKKYLCRDVMEMLIGQTEWKREPAEASSLTASEIEIVKLIADGLTTKEIALRKNVSFHTIMTHRKNIFRKARVNNASELIMFAIRSGFIDSIEYQI